MSIVPLTVGGVGYCVHSTSQWEGSGVLCPQYFSVGRGVVLCPQYLSQWEGWGTVSTVPLSGRVQGCFVHSTSHSGRGGVLCPQYLSQWEGWGTVSTVPLTVGGGAVSTVSLRAGGRRGAVSTVSHSRGVQGSCGARSRPLAPGGAGSGGAVSCQAHHTASPFAVSCLALPASILWHLFQKTCLLPPTPSPRLF